MKIRLKFTKQGAVKFVGHLDTMRLFQRAIKVAKIPVAYSQGFNPHSLVYFAMPLSVGVSSMAEYMDIVTHTDISPEEVKRLLNDILVEGIVIKDAFLVEEHSDSLMSLVHAAAYEIDLPKQDFSHEDISILKESLKQEEIITRKKGKKGMKSVDIKPMILDFSVEELPNSLKMFLNVLAGSKENLSPQLFLKAVLKDEEVEKKDIAIMRKELYTYDSDYIALDCYRRKK